MALVTVEDVRTAAARIEGTVVRTPLLPAGWGDAGRPLWLKPESLQPTGAFKLRGATNAVALLDADQRARGVIAHSSGNHAQALALAAGRVGVRCVVVMPVDTPAGKVAATRSNGAEVVFVPPGERDSTVAALAAEYDYVVVPPYDDEAVIAGQGTVGLEIAEDIPDVDVVLVPVSGGGLISGIAVAVKALCPTAAVIGCEPALAGDLAESWQRGERVAWSAERTGRTVADGLRVTTVGDLPWQHIRALVDDVVTVSEEAILEAMAALVRQARLVVEPSGAVAVAAYRERAADLPSGATVAVVSGGNVEPGLLSGVLARTTGRQRAAK